MEMLYGNRNWLGLASHLLLIESPILYMYGSLLTGIRVIWLLWDYLGLLHQ